MNFWDTLIESPENAALYMDSYGEGVGFDTRKFVSSFINDGESVLDVGCGPAWNYEHFEKYGPDVSAYKGIDYSEYMIIGALSKYPTASLEVGDVRDIKEIDGSWDVVICQDCLEHTNGYEKPVRELLRVAKKRVIISFWHLTDDDNPHINDDGNDGWGAWYDKREWEKFLDSLDLFWLHDEIQPKGKNHSWHFYIIDLEQQHGK